jgi:serine/threonine protein kinase
VLIYYICTHHYPFTGTNTFNIIESIKSKEPNLSLIHNEDLRHLLHQMLKKDPNERIRISEAKMNLYFSEIDFSHVFDL